MKRDEIKLDVYRLVQLVITSSISAAVIAVMTITSLSVTMLMFVLGQHVPEYLFYLDNTFIGYWFGRFHSVASDEYYSDRSKVQ